MTSTGEAVLFWVLAPAMVLGALGLVFARKAVYAALSMIFVMVSLAVVYVMQQAEFLGIVQVVVYTGAVMMLFVFVLMLVGVDASTSAVETIKGQRWIGVLMGLGLGTLLITVTSRATLPAAVGLDSANSETNPAGLARILMSDFVLDLEIVAVLLVTAALASLVLTHRRRLTPKIGQAERAERRLLAGEHPVNLPAPGVYARHNAMDVPALDPEGNPIEASVSRVLRIRGQEHGLGTDVTTLVQARTTAELDAGDQASDTAATRGGRHDQTDAATTEGEA
ncbi:NADH-quinone oxidoreductase subunit J [Sanguibacter sp. A247]|uniref:NADH-quinone oxidoreductase subunit J n=1 Tax=unclassified Sanguibacter TaxID=2645534 RepID=UPI003FD7BF4E